MPNTEDQILPGLLEDELPETITKGMLEKLVIAKDFQKIGRKTMICCLVLRNGFEVIGTASCVVEQKFDADIGMEFSEKDAMEQLWMLQGYLLQEDRANRASKCGYLPFGVASGG